ncbi:MAG TPA: TIR domain-containing protein [Pseudonocardiaceae bacterium]|nr:TIR domain-containing protein [Pseudonocardiaceae bacterium]
MPTFFLNYRTDDGEFAATLIDRALSDRFGSGNVFRAPKSIPPGSDFERAILAAVRQSDVLLAVIGTRWLTAVDSAGLRRLDDPEDWVRREIAEAIRCDIPVVPVLVDKTDRLTGAPLPSDIAQLAKAQNVRLDHRTADHDLAQLGDKLIRLVSDSDEQSPPPPAADEQWRGGAEIRLGNLAYRLHDGIEQVMAPDRSWVWRQADADQLDRSRPVMLRQATVLRRTKAAETRYDAMRREIDLYGDLRTVPGLPRLATHWRTPDQVTAVLSRPATTSLRVAYGPWPLEFHRVDDFLRALGEAGNVLWELHRRGHSHRALDPDAIVIDKNTHRIGLRDLGLATVEPTPGEGRSHYQAPEQHRPPERGDAGSAVDVFGLAAIGYHVLTGHPSIRPVPPPIRATDGRFSNQLERLLTSALAADPAARPKTARFVAELTSLT